MTTNLSNGIVLAENIINFDLERSCYCGQAFRWTNDGTVYSCVIGDDLVRVWQKDDCLFTLPCDESKMELYREYFDLERDYALIEQRMAQNPMLKRCIPYASGIRVFAQDPFETLISFIISANNNISRITGIIDRLCKRCGDKKVSFDGIEYYTFPNADRLAALSLSELRAMGTGYRDEYIKRTAQAVADGFVLEDLKVLPYAEAKKKLCTLHGVGGKVADCVLLFSLGHGEAFPMDVWMKRAISKMFFGNAEPTREGLEKLLTSFGRDAGRIQQYIFHYARETGLKEIENVG